MLSYNEPRLLDVECISWASVVCAAGHISRCGRLRRSSWLGCCMISFDQMDDGFAAVVSVTAACKAFVRTSPRPAARRNPGRPITTPR